MKSLFTEVGLSMLEKQGYVPKERKDIFAALIECARDSISLTTQLAELRGDNEKVSAALDRVINSRSELAEKHRTLRTQLETAVEALEFYAEKSNWVSQSGRIGTSSIDTQDREAGGTYNFAGGKQAREALAKIRGVG